MPWILRAAVRRLGLRPPPLLRRTRAGRPYLAHPDGVPWEIDFNISHSGGLVGIGLGAGGRVGLDVQEPPARGWERIGRRWLHPGEWERIEALPPDAGRAAFTRAWAVREARCKATGRGLAGFRSPTALPTALPAADGGRLDGVSWRELPLPGGYAGALAWAGRDGREWLGRPVVVGWEERCTR
ncbi:4'-phosphopantetheinyl transferase superfamily protein [Actinomadura sp. J1-007]|uniref:4'-phosphopantetheinyl transferase family protein n=1 Tax=Actinomadura sp. J1-007 TaxID=2661913 RepID=UPI00132AB069|nr:4'-phosphopantetheinyl transferase superfamily protein [Actinomadura sp. J1-007]MWK38909.1 4'-phosphopantetheinyl transferase superfamily protein [Actinomadura sp. J1-007]